MIVLCDRVVSERSGKLLRHEMEGNVADAARKKEWEEVRRLVEQGGNVNCVDRFWLTALHYAIKDGNSDICLFLLSRGANVNQTDEDEDTPLHLAAYRHYVDICQLLVDHKADVTSVNNKGQTPLHRAVDTCNLLFSCFPHPCVVNVKKPRIDDSQTAQLLVECGADVNALNEDGQRPLHTAAGGWQDCPELCSILLEYHAKIDAVDKDGNQPLHLACKRGHTRTSHLLLFNGADVNTLNENGQTPLHTAAGGWEDCPELCSILLEYNAKIDVVDKDGNQPLHLACKRGHTRTSRLLLSNGADVNALDKDGLTLLHTVAGGWQDCPELCSILLKHNAKIDAVDEDGNQPLHLACKQGHTRTSRLLLSNGADVKGLNENGHTPLHTAAGGWEDCPELCSILLKHNAKIDAVDEDGNQPLHLACKQGHTRTSRLLLSNGADVKGLNENGQTPLHTAAGGWEDCPELCSILLKHNAKIDAVDEDGNQPLHLAWKRGRTRTSRLLLSNGADVNALNEDGQTPLHTAAGRKKDCPELCSILLKHNAKIDAEDKDGNQPLHLACSRLHSETCSLLVSHGANRTSLNKQQKQPVELANESVMMNFKVEKSNHALHIASRNGDTQTVQLLVDCGADVNVLNEDGQTPLHTAAGGWEDCPELCSVLLKHNAKIDAVDKGGNQPLHLACSRLHSETCSLLVSHGANRTSLNKQQKQPVELANESVMMNFKVEKSNHALHIASRNGDTQTVQLLVDCGADVNALNKDGQTPLHTAAGGWEDCPELCSVLLKHNAKIDAVDEDGNQPLHLAWKRGHTRTSRLLLSNGADVNALDKDGLTLLHTVAGGWQDCPELCSILLKHNAKIDVVDKDGNQPLHLAWKRGHTKTSRLLLSNGADVNALDKDGLTLLHTAAGGKKDCPELCSILLKHNAKIDAVDKDGNQPLHLACEAASTSTVQRLLDCNADVFATNNSHQTALHKAACSKRDCPEVCVMLIAKGSQVNATDGNGDTSLQVAYQKGKMNTADVLVENDADCNVVNVCGETLLHWACKSRVECVELCDKLISHGVNPHIADREGKLPLHVALKNRLAKTFGCLLQKSGEAILDDLQKVTIDKEDLVAIFSSAHEANDINTCGDIIKFSAKLDPSTRLSLRALNCHTTIGYLLIQRAVKEQNITFCQHLIDHGASVNADVPHGYRDRTFKDPPLHLAVKLGDTDLCRLLIEHGATIDPEMRGRIGALHLAVVSEQKDVARLLLSHGADLSKVEISGESALKRLETRGNVKMASIIQATGE